MLPLLSQAQVLNWDFEDIVTDRRESGANPDFYFTDDGNVHISYWDRQRDVLMYGVREAATGAWTFEKVLNNLVSYGARSALAVDAFGTVHIAFHDKNAVEEAELRYTSKTGGAWTLESPIGNASLGPYGFDFSTPRNSQGSLDVELTADGRPVIACYDGSAGNINFCLGVQVPVYTQYDLDLSVIEKNSAGAWIEHALPDLPEKDNSGCLPLGDRFGEFCQIIPRTEDNWFILTNSMHNHELILFESDSADLSTWTVHLLDSSENFNLPSVARFFESFDRPRATLVGDSLLHISSSLSWLYGSENTVLPRNPFLYYQFGIADTGGTASVLTMNDFERFLPNNLYRSYGSIAATNNDTIYIPLVNVRSNQLEIQYTFNSGGFWVNDTLGFLSTVSRLESRIAGDSLYIWAYDQLKNGLVEYAVSLDIVNWTSRYITVTEIRGKQLDSEVIRNPGSDDVIMAFYEDFYEEIRLAERTGGAWTFETVAGIPEAASLELIRLPGGELEILISGDDPDQVVSAMKNGTQWTVSPVAAFSLRELNSFVDSDSVYVAGRKIPGGELKWLSQPVSGGSWTISTLDTASLPTGQSAVIQRYMDTLYVAYFSSGDNFLQLAKRPDGAGWQFEQVTQPLNYVPVNLDFDVRSDGIPVIVFKDANTNRVFLTERRNGVWQINPVPTDPGNLIGSPLALILDSKDRPWILYNYPDVQDDLRLLRRSASGDWVGVSVLNNVGQVANTFDFHLVEDDFYILGRKNDLGNEGLGLLFAENGVRTDLETEMAGLSMTLMPNPARDQATLSLEAEVTRQATLTIYNLQGQILHSESMILQLGTQEIGLPIETLSPGSYLIAVQTDKQSAHQILLIVP